MTAEPRTGLAGAGPGEAAPVGFRHEAFLYATPDDYAARSASFARDGVAAGEPVLVAVPGAKVGVIRDALGGDARHVTFLDMAVLGRNPARIIPAWREFADRARGNPARGIGEPIWAGRGPAEMVECQRHERLLNLAFAAAPAFWLLCPYDTGVLPPPVVTEALRSHPVVFRDGAHGSSRAYTAAVPGLDENPLPDPPAGASVVPFHGEQLAALRALVGRAAGAAGVDPSRAADLLLAVHEVATNTIRYGGGAGTLRTWTEPGAFVCEIRDHGLIGDPLIGRERPGFDREGGRGLWIVNQLCDLVEVRSGAAGTVVRMRVTR